MSCEKEWLTQWCPILLWNAGVESMNDVWYYHRLSKAQRIGKIATNENSLGTSSCLSKPQFLHLKEGGKNVCPEVPRLALVPETVGGTRWFPAWKLPRLPLQNPGSTVWSVPALSHSPEFEYRVSLSLTVLGKFLTFTTVRGQIYLSYWFVLRVENILWSI